MTRNKGPKTEAYQLHDFLHDASLKVGISIIDQLGLETLQTCRNEQQLIKEELQKEK